MWGELSIEMSDADPVRPSSSARSSEREEEEYIEAKKASRGVNAPNDAQEATKKSEAVAQLNQEYNAWTCAEAPTLFEGGIV